MNRGPVSHADEIYESLWALVPTTASLSAIAQRPVLLDLARTGVGVAASTDELAVTAREGIIAGCRALDDPELAVEPRFHGEGAAVMTLLGLATGYHAAPLHRRRDGAAGLLGYEVGTAFKTRPGVRSQVKSFEVV